MNHNSKVLSLKYRPKVFEDLIGQEVVAETIINSIKSKKIPNAYLFTGIRGVGKTTIARIIAKSLNCLSSAITFSGDLYLTFRVHIDLDSQKVHAYGQPLEAKI